MNPISTIIQVFQEYRNIQGNILHCSAPFWLIYLFLIPIKLILQMFVQHGAYSNVCWILMLQDDLQLQST